jgi:hypothetical protein
LPYYAVGQGTDERSGLSSGCSPSAHCLYSGRLKSHRTNGLCAVTKASAYGIQALLALRCRIVDKLRQCLAVAIDHKPGYVRARVVPSLIEVLSLAAHLSVIQRCNKQVL